MYNFWDLNPIGFLRVQVINRKDCLLKVIFSKADFVVFTDGFKVQKYGTHLAGIGGILINPDAELCFLFSGPFKGTRFGTGSKHIPTQ